MKGAFCDFDDCTHLPAMKVLDVFWTSDTRKIAQKWVNIILTFISRCRSFLDVKACYLLVMITTNKI